MMIGALLDKIIDLALAEDLGSGDLTTDAVVATDLQAVALAVAKGPLVICGAAVFSRTFHRVDETIRVTQRLRDGARAQAGDVLWEVHGSARSILMAERTALNFAQRLSGIASLTRKYVQALPEGSEVRITDTRKTTPGLRALERYAVRTGGAFNHRDNLGAAILIKDNHIAVAGGVREAVVLARRRAPHGSRIEVEVESLDELDAALTVGADIVLLDNFAPEQLHEALRRAKGRALVEVSGGITIERVAELARAGVDVISIGALTHSSPAADIALDVRI